MTLELKFSESGGYDAMTGAWEIFTVDRKPTGETVYQTLVTVDQSDFGQEHCDYAFRSEQAEHIARICYNALRREHGVPEDSNVVRAQ